MVGAHVDLGTWLWLGVAVGVGLIIVIAPQFVKRITGLTGLNERMISIGALRAMGLAWLVLCLVVVVLLAVGPRS
jgi:hypothetical protein